MELIKVKNSSQNLYEELVLEKDRLKKEAVLMRAEYYHVFGEKIIENFKQKIRCIELKKKIAYCQAMVNSGKDISEYELRSFIKRQMKDYYSSLENITNYTASITMVTVPEINQRKIKKLYREMAKMVHPDLHPELQSDPKIVEIWNKIVMAYENNDLGELEELSFMVRRYLDNQADIEIEDIEEKIEKLQQQIHTIKNTDPYQYKYLLEDPLMVEDKFKELEREFKEYVDYEANLLLIYQRFDVKGVLN